MGNIERKIKSSKMPKNHWYDKLVLKEIKRTEVIETNALIAQFMGYRVDDSNEFFSGVHYYQMTKDMPYSECTIDNVRSCTEGFVWHYATTWEKRYDTCWNQLMEVIEKIESVGMEFYIINNIAAVKGTLLEHPITKHPITAEFDWRGSLKTDTKFNSCYWAVKSFVKWYNQIKNN